MYSSILTIHSITRWLVLLSLLFAIFNAYKGWLAGDKFSRSDNVISNIVVSIVHIQLILGLWLYFLSPITNYFLNNFQEAIHERQIRFFGMEHSFMMFVAIIIITIGSAKTKRRSTDKEKFKTMAIWFTIGLLFILSSIPWFFLHW